MTPHFDLQGGWPLLAARLAMICALLSAFGTAAFRVIVLPRVFARMAEADTASIKGWMRRLAQASAAAALAAACLWLVLESADMADAHGLAETFAAVPTVMAATAFGHVLLAQAAILAALIGVNGARDTAWRVRAGFCLAALALCLNAGHSHAWSMHDGPSLLLAFDVLHLLGAGAWLGGLVPLLLVVRGAPPQAGAAAARWFSPLGQACIAAVTVSATYQAWIMIASVPGLVGTAYGWVALAKLALFGALLGFAAANRYRFAPALLRSHPAQARRVLVRSIASQTGAALAIAAAAALLSALPPAMHDQPLWPFAQRVSTAAIDEDAGFRAEVFEAATALAAALAVLVMAIVLRRWRWPALGLALLAAWFAAPHFDLLLVPAYPTSFFHSPTGFSTASIVQGRDIYAAHCVACHGTDGRGDHPIAGLPIPPADLTAAHLWAHSDGELFWWLSHGITTPEGAQAMPGFAAVLDDDQIWAVIDFIRARNAGTAMHDSGSWPHVMPAAGFDAACGPNDIGLADLRGRFIRLRFGGVTAASPANLAATVIASSNAAGAAGACVTTDETVASAYGIVSGLDATQMAGTEFLIDDLGRLRAMQRADASPGWSDPAVLAADIANLRAHPPEAAMPMPMHMPM